MMRRFLAISLLLTSFGTPAYAQTPADGHEVVRPVKRSSLWLGLSLKREAEPSGPGVEVNGILRRSPSDGSGVKIGDRVISIGNTPVNSMREIRRAVNASGNGDVVDVGVKRGKKELTLKFKLSPLPDPESIMRNHLMGFEAPDFEFQYVGDGKKARLSDLKGKPTIIDFWATWCGPCHKVQAGLADIKDKFGDRINLVGISDESAKRVRAHLERYPARYAMATDNGASRDAYSVQSIPLLVVLNAEHRVVGVLLGFRQMADLDAKLENLVGPPNATKADFN